MVSLEKKLEYLSPARRAEIERMAEKMIQEEAMGKQTPLPWEYGVRPDGSIWVSLGSPDLGTHYQFDWHASGYDARMAMGAPAMFDLLREVYSSYAATGSISKGTLGRIKLVVERLSGAV